MLKLVYTEWLSLDDVLILLPKSWIRCRTHCDHGLDLGLFKLDHVPSPDQHADIDTAPRAALAIQKVVAAIYGRQIKH